MFCTELGWTALGHLHVRTVVVQLVTHHVDLCQVAAQVPRWSCCPEWIRSPVGRALQLGPRRRHTRIRYREHPERTGRRATDKARPKKQRFALFVFASPETLIQFAWNRFAEEERSVRSVHRRETNFGTELYALRPAERPEQENALPPESWTGAVEHLTIKSSKIFTSRFLTPGRRLVQHFETDAGAHREQIRVADQWQPFQYQSRPLVHQVGLRSGQQLRTRRIGRGPSKARRVPGAGHGNTELDWKVRPGCYQLVLAVTTHFWDMKVDPIRLGQRTLGIVHYQDGSQSAHSSFRRLGSLSTTATRFGRSSGMLLELLIPRAYIDQRLSVPRLHLGRTFGRSA